MSPAVTLDQRQPPRLSRLRAPLGAAAAVGLAAAALRLRDPHQQGSWGLCPFKALTGWNCPGCGGLRAVNDLTHGQLDAALHSNLLFVGLLPLIVLGWGWWLQRRWTTSEPVLSTRSLQVLGCILVVAGIGFTVIRNTPWGQAFAVS